MHLQAFILSTIIVGTSCLTLFSGGSVDFQFSSNAGSQYLASALSALQSAQAELGKLESQAQLIKTSTTEGTAEYQQGMTNVLDGLAKLQEKLASEVQGNLAKFASQSPNVVGKLIAQKLKDTLATVSQSIQSSLEKLLNPDNVNALSSALKAAVGQVTEKIKSTLAPLTENLSKLQDILKGSSASVQAALPELLQKVLTAVAGIKEKLASIDTSLPTSGGVDTGLPSSGGVDTGLPSSGGVDTGLPYPGEVDTGLPSSGGVDTGLPSSGNVYPDVPVPEAPGTAEACASGSAGTSGGASAGASVPESG